MNITPEQLREWADTIDSVLPDRIKPDVVADIFRAHASALERLDEVRKELQFTQDQRNKATAKLIESNAEIARLKAHAEAMHSLCGRAMRFLDPKDGLVIEIHNARCYYRRDFPEDK